MEILVAVSTWGVSVTQGLFSECLNHTILPSLTLESIWLPLPFYLLQTSAVFLSVSTCLCEVCLW